MTPAVRTELLVFRFDAAEGRFEGQLGGALERAESGGALRIVRLLFIGREAGSGELAVTDLRGGTGGLVARLLSFRLDHANRERTTAKALAPGSSGVPAEILEELGTRIGPGEAIAAVLVEHVWAAALADAVARTGGREIADEMVTTGDAADFGRRVLELSASRSGGSAAAADC
jgi:hypothetical protein